MPFNGLMSTDVFQQSFMGLSIMDFSVNAGLNSSQSTLSLNLVTDDGFIDHYNTLDIQTLNINTTNWGQAGRGGPFSRGLGGGFSMGSTSVSVGVRDAVTEGYHPWDPNAFPATLIQKFGNVAGVKENYAFNGDYGWFPPPGAPVYFHYYSTANLNTNCVTDRNCTPVFRFAGILGDYNKSFSTSGITYSVNISDPRTILENTLVILEGEVGRVAPADKHYLLGGGNIFAFQNERKYEHGWNGYYNIINVYGYYESHGYNQSKLNDQGIPWFEAKNGKVFSNDYGVDHHFGVLPAIDFIAAGTNLAYQQKLEPYGGPAYYGIDDRNITTRPPFSDTNNGQGVYKYAIDLSALYNLSKDYNPNPPAPGVLDDRHRVKGGNISLLQLIQQICEAAGADFMVEMFAPRKGEPFYQTHKDYAGIIRVIPISRKMDVSIGVLEKAIDMSQETPPKGPFVSTGPEGQSILIDSSVGYEFTDPVQGKILFGGPQTRIVGVTPLGDVKLREELFYNTVTNKYLDTNNNAPNIVRDDVLHEYMPSIETDGVTLHTQAAPLDTFRDRKEKGWNPLVDRLREGGIDKRPDFKQNLPMVSNDDYLPYHFAEDYSGFLHNEADPYQFGRVNSKFYDDFNLNGGASSGYLDMFPCWGFEKVEYNSTSSFLKDEVNKSIKGQPIKGMFFDDDPYRDFHPINGIFGVFDWINPSLGECRVAEDFEDPANPGVVVHKKGEVIPEYENRPLICECDYMTSPIDSDCYTVKNAGVKARGKFQSYCKANKRCEAAGGEEITEIHKGSAGEGNNLHKTKYSCEKGCFLADSNGLPTGTAIIAFYTEDVGTKTQGQAANVNDNEWMSNPPGTKGSKIKIITNKEECEIESIIGLPQGTVRVTGDVEASGSFTNDPTQANKFTAVGGMYDEKCIGISYKYPHSTHCEAIADLTDQDGNQYRAGDWLPSTTFDDCTERFGVMMVRWVNAMTEFPSNPIQDDFYNQTIPTKKIPAPGYVNTRFRYTGECKPFGLANPALLPVSLWDKKFDCYQAGGSYFDEDHPDSEPVVAKSATIPIDLGLIGYTGGPRASNNILGGGAHFYYATVTELRHAAVSKDSWTSYLTNLGQKLPCHMWKKDPIASNAWSDFCRKADEVMFKGGTSEAHLAIPNNLNFHASGGASGSPTINNSVTNHAGNPNTAAAKAATGHPCGDSERNELSLGERTQMEVDVAYQKVQEVATQFYGRKYLVPLPFNPPTSHTCSNLRFKKKAKCEDEGYDWGPHGMLSEWFQKMGVGNCTDGISPDKFTCEIINGGFWIEPIKIINKWEIASAGWPGGSIDYTWDETKNTGYPQNTNFWTQDGNLESFVVFPSHERKRFSADSSRLDFRNFDPETVHESKVPAAPLAGWGNKVFVKTSVDPETHWIYVRPKYEVLEERQHPLYRAGDDDGPDKKHKLLNRPKDFLEIGTDDNRVSVDERDVFVREQDSTLSDYYKETAAYKPYALVTLPNQVFYGDMDQTTKFHHQIGEGKDMCIPLVRAKNSNSLMSAWLQSMSRDKIVGQQLRAFAANLRNAPVISPDLGRGSIQAAAYKPFHAAIPQTCKYYKWGPWALGTGFGKVDYEIDTSIQPSAFGGEKEMANFAMAGIKTTLQNVEHYIETGSVTLAGLPEHAFATQMVLPVNGVNLLGPFITDISVAMGSSGLTTTYNFTTQEKFADVDKINRERIRRNQEDMLKLLKHTEEQIVRTKRDIQKYIK
jgi:hypothetical protein